MPYIVLFGATHDARLRAVNDNALERAPPPREQPARLQATMHYIVFFGATHDNHHQPASC